AKTLDGLAKDNQSTISVDVSPEVTVTADPEAMERILLNLADNAVRHGGSEVHMSALSRGKTTLIVISDDGDGIPEEERGAVFERFQRGQQARRTGTGLGLAIARELAHSIDGTLQLSSAATGTRFELEVPS
ncbi:MAG: ATP-binding protein, partial [Myxococcota bacterium]